MVYALNKKIAISVFIIVEVIVAIFMFSSINDFKNQQTKLSKKMIKQEATSHFESILITRSWSARHGGVYVKQHDNIQPNPYLEDNHVFSDTGDLYIKINPAWMTRQISEITNKESNYYYKITSLMPINPNNKVDAFEKKALELFEKNKNIKEYYDFSKDSKTFDYIGALKIEKPCLQCHAKQGYKLGDIRGGIRVSIPMNKYQEDFRVLKSKTLMLKTVVTIIAIIVGILFFLFINTIYKRQQEIEDLSITDPLTGLFNRRHFNTICKEEINKAQRNKMFMAFMLLDIDYFKDYNDTYGHLAGDEVLKKISKVLKNMTRRATDFAFRVGGEEFGIIFSVDEGKKAYEYADKIRSEIEKLQIEHKKNKPYNVLTISAGICLIDDYKDNGCSMDNVYAKADKKLYEAKESGKNKVAY